MPDILVWIELSQGQIRKIDRECLGLARNLVSSSGGKVIGALIGHGIADTAKEMAAGGCDLVCAVDGPEFAEFRAEAYTDAVSAVIAAHPVGMILCGTNFFGKELAARLAGRLRAPAVTDVTGVEMADGKLLITKPRYAGKVIATLEISGSPVILALRPNLFPVFAGTTGGQVENVPVTPRPQSLRAKVEAVTYAHSDLPDVAEGEIVVSGGRGMKGPETFAMLEELARLLHAAVGASRAVVNAGWIDHSHQVGQTGKTVSPQLYIACGISGAIQHLAGMSTSRVIVAINKDPEANIFKLCDYGIVGDLFQVVPAFTKEVRKLKAE